MPRFNPLPFLFAPGAGLIGWLVAGPWGAFVGCVCWVAVVGLATAYLLHRQDKRSLPAVPARRAAAAGKPDLPQ